MHGSKVLPIAMCVALAGCASTTRKDADAFKLMDSGTISPTKQRAFVGCLTDGFGKAHWAGSPIISRQQILEDTIRVESIGGNFNTLLESADVNNDGTVALYESRSAVVDLRGERETFAACLARFTVSKPRS